MILYSRKLLDNHKIIISMSFQLFYLTDIEGKNQINQHLYIV